MRIVLRRQTVILVRVLLPVVPMKIARQDYPVYLVVAVARHPASTGDAPIQGLLAAQAIDVPAGRVTEQTTVPRAQRVSVVCA